MPAVYSIDLIAQRDKKNKMNNSIIKGWNVHYQTLQEAEDAAKQKQQKLEQEQARHNVQDEAAQAQPQPEADDEKESKDAYNAKTGSYSGHYGKKPVHDEDAKQQINAILSEKTDAFHAALSELKGQESADQP